MTSAMQPLPVRRGHAPLKTIAGVLFLAAVSIVLVCSKAIGLDSLSESSQWISVVDKNTRSAIELEATDCIELLKKFRSDEIEAVKTVDKWSFRRAFATITNTSKPFYVSTHDSDFDPVRGKIFTQHYYYETELTKRVAEIFDDKSAQGKSSIMLDVGANIGWFSLIAAAHGASKVYAFEPNVLNTVRLCESLSMNNWLHGDPQDDVVCPITKGVGNLTEQKQFYAHRNPGSSNFLGKGGKHKGWDLDIITLDSFAARHGWFESKPSIGFFKLDVEGYDLQVIEGAQKLLKSRLIEKIAMECKHSFPAEAKSNMMKILFEAGYELYMHGRWLGPRIKVTAYYARWEDLAGDINNRKYHENLLFQLRKQ